MSAKEPEENMHHTNELVKQTVEERGKVYGDVRLCHENIGFCWTALIQQHYQTKLDHPIPPFLVAQMMVAMKGVRAARVYHQDNFTDARAYLDFSEDFQKTP